jgi:type IV pilus assembly protein PilY1
VASGSGAVFFTTFSPAADVCGYGGESHLWAVNYATGAAPPVAAMQGSALMQASTGSLTQVSLSTAFSNPSNLGYNNRRLAQPITGVPPLGNGLALMSNPKPSKKILHYQEK